MTSIRVKLEMGHTAIYREAPTATGMTHDWHLFIRGLDSDCTHFIQKVVFHLHDSFLKPKREVKKAPFEIREHGYGSFNSQIEVFFKNLGDPDKITYQYDLFLRRDIQPVKHLRCETLTFKHPNSEFKQLLLLANGEIIYDKSPTNYNEDDVSKLKKISYVPSTSPLNEIAKLKTPETSPDAVTSEKKSSKKEKHRKRKHSKDRHHEHKKHKDKKIKKKDAEGTSKGGLALLLADMKVEYADDSLISPLSNTSSTLTTASLSKTSVESTPKAAPEVAKSFNSGDSKTSAIEVSKPSNDATKPPNDATKPSNDATKPPNDATKPSSSHKTKERTHKSSKHKKEKSSKSSNKKSHKSSHHKSKKHRSSQDNTPPSTAVDRINEFHIPTTPVTPATPPTPQKVKSSPMSTPGKSPVVVDVGRKLPVEVGKNVASTARSNTPTVKSNPTPRSNTPTVKSNPTPRSNTPTVKSNPTPQSNTPTLKKHSNKPPGKVKLGASATPSTTPSVTISSPIVPPSQCDNNTFTPITASADVSPPILDNTRYLSPCNGYLFNDLIKLQRKLFLIAPTDASLLRNISNIMRAGHKDTKNTARTEFDLCALDKDIVDKLSLLLC